MAIWLMQATVEDLNAHSSDTLVSHLGIEFVEIGDDYLRARMPVDARTVQPARILHGGASVALAESVGSIAAHLCVDQERKYCVGLDINANHIRAVRSGDLEMEDWERPDRIESLLTDLVGLLYH